MNEIRIYEVGGAVRDRILGVPSKDIDYAVEAPSYEDMKNYITADGAEIFLESPEYVTIRARMGKTVADFVLCRKDGTYSDGRRPDSVEIGTIYDDLARRDFTINAIAIDEYGNYIDPFNGIRDIENRVIRCVGNSEDRMREDYLRLLRAARFSITKRMVINDEIERLFYNNSMLSSFALSVSVDRIREELYKMFNYSTLDTIDFFGRYKGFSLACFNNLWLKPTSEKR